MTSGTAGRFWPTGPIIPSDCGMPWNTTLASGAELVIHVGPDPKLLTTCFDRLSHKIMKQLKMRHLDRLGLERDPEHQQEWLADPKASRQRGAIAGSIPSSSGPGGLVAGPGCLITSLAVPEGSGERAARLRQCPEDMARCGT